MSEDPANLDNTEFRKRIVDKNKTWQKSWEFLFPYKIS